MDSINIKITKNQVIKYLEKIGADKDQNEELAKELISKVDKKLLKTFVMDTLIKSYAKSFEKGGK